MKLNSTKKLQEATEQLITIEPQFKRAVNASGYPQFRRPKQQDFSALVNILVSQQLSLAAADSIWQRLEDNKLTQANNIQQATDEDLRQCGLSKQKIRYIRSLCEAGIDFKALNKKDDNSVHKTLTAVLGIGDWTAEIFLIFNLHRGDIFAPKDLALQESAKLLFELSERPTDKAIANMAKAWMPYRSVAAMLLWRYYRHIKAINQR